MSFDAFTSSRNGDPRQCASVSFASADNHSFAEVLDQPEVEDELSRRLTRGESWLMRVLLLTVATAISAIVIFVIGWMLLHRW